MHASFSFHHSNLQLAYTTQVWKLKFKTCAMQANIWNALLNAPIKFMSLAPLCVCSNFNWSPYFVISLLLCQILPLSLTSLFLSPLLSIHYIFVHYFSPFVINDHKGSKCRWVEIINVKQWGEDHSSKNLFQSRSFAKDI